MIPGPGYPVALRVKITVVCKVSYTSFELPFFHVKSEKST
jgi:hypothetical protein